MGRTIEVDGVTREVIGIMPAGFDLMDRQVELWLPSSSLLPSANIVRVTFFRSWDV